MATRSFPEIAAGLSSDRSALLSKAMSSPSRTPESGAIDWEDGAIRTHSEIAAEMGISRARVFYHEKVALTKIRSALVAGGFYGSMDDQEIEKASRPIKPRTRPPTHEESHSPLHGWLPVSRIVSLNDGSTDCEDVARAFTLLKLSKPNEIHVPFKVSRAEGLSEPYRVEAAANVRGFLHVRLWPITGGSRSVKELVGLPSVAIVDSEFDSDSDGDFDIPILLAVFVSARAKLKAHA